MTDRRRDNGKAPRSRLLQSVDALLDGTRTAAEIAVMLGCKPEYVRATVARQGWQGRLKRGVGGRGNGVPAHARTLPEPTRADDARILGWLQDRCAGLSVAAIARAARCGASHVQTTLTAVRDADLSESGEPTAEVLQGYQWGKA